MIVKDVTLGFDPEQTCEKVQLCTSKWQNRTEMAVIVAWSNWFLNYQI